MERLTEQAGNIAEPKVSVTEDGHGILLIRKDIGRQGYAYHHLVTSNLNLWFAENIRDLTRESIPRQEFEMECRRILPLMYHLSTEDEVLEVMGAIGEWRILDLAELESLGKSAVGKYQNPEIRDDERDPFLKGYKLFQPEVSLLADLRKEDCAVNVCSGFPFNEREKLTWYVLRHIQSSLASVFLTPHPWISTLYTKTLQCAFSGVGTIMRDDDYRAVRQITALLNIEAHMPQSEEEALLQLRGQNWELPSFLSKTNGNIVFESDEEKMLGAVRRLKVA